MEGFFYARNFHFEQKQSQDTNNQQVKQKQTLAA